MQGSWSLQDEGPVEILIKWMQSGLIWLSIMSNETLQYHKCWEPYNSKQQFYLLFFTGMQLSVCLRGK
jgi:hypothetical protein